MRKSNGSRNSILSIVSGLALFTSLATVVGIGVFAFAGRTGEQEQASQGSSPSRTPDETSDVATDKDFDASFLKLRTAEQLLEVLESDEYLIMTELPEVEVEKVAKVLRNKYPMVSLRERMGDMPIALAKTEKAVDLPHISWGNRRASALKSIHSNEVSKFINSEGFGLTRSPPPSIRDLKFADEYATKIDRTNVGSAYLEGQTIELQKTGQEGWTSGALALSENGVPSSEYMSLLSQHNAMAFAGGQSTGFVQDIDHVAGFNEHRFRANKDWNGSIDHEDFFGSTPSNMPKWKDVDWKMNRVELVSLLLNEEPKVYVSENLPDMEELSSETAEKRDLDPFELESLERLRAGENVVTQSTLNRIIMLGAIRADATCMECHDVKEKELLGAFSYEILRHPPVNPIADAKPF